MTPKTIHYCWFGRNPLPESAKECIASWKKFMPGYEIKEWNEDNFDVNMTTYTAEAYKAKKYAFVSDYARFWILYNYGGLYFDTDVEMLKPIDDIVAKGGFMGIEKTEGNDIDKLDSNTILIAPGLGLGVEKGHEFYKEILDIYNNKHFITWSGSFTGTVVETTTNHILSKTKICKDKISEFQGIYIYPDEYFDPMNYYTKEIKITPNTRTIHKYAATWVSKKKKSIWNSIKGRLSFVLIRISAKKK